MDRIPKGYVAFGPRANCTLEVCSASASILGYQPSRPASGVFIGLIGLSLLLHIAQGVYFKKWGFMAMVVAGCIDEILGYVGRVLLYSNPFSYIGFMLQIVCITTAPVFFCAAIYVMLSQTIEYIDRSQSRFNPRLFYWIFIPCDFISLVLQAAGGAISVVSTTKEQVQRGVNISLAGLVFQVVTLAVFSALFVDYLVRCRKSSHWNVLPKSLKIFLAFLFLSILFIFVRCCYRVKELSLGYFSDFFRDETLFIGLESAMMTAAVLCLNVGHPSIGFRKPLGGREFDRSEAGPMQTSGHEKSGSGTDGSIAH